jgi:Tol biopolymer transport system component
VAPGRRPSPLARLPFSVAPALSAIGLLIVGGLSLALLTGSLPTIPGGGDGGDGGPIRTATPSNVVVTDPRTDVPGSLLYVKAGNIWLQSGARSRQLTDGGRDAMPTWSPDGQWIYFIRIAREEGRWPSGGELRTYNLSVPSLVRMRPDGTGVVETLLTGRVERGSNRWSYFIRQPSIAPDGATAALITDGPDPTKSDVVLKLLDLAELSLSDPKLAQSQALGHQDPAWAPDGSALLFVKNAREGTRGTPSIVRYTLATKKSAALTGPGYISPAWSRDGRFVAATQTGSFGTDIVILDAGNGTELLRLTRDERSFDPVWSPAGDAVAFFRVERGVVDLYLLPLEGTAPNWTIGEPLALTVSAGLDAGSRPAWFIPADQLPPPTPTPAPTPGAGSASPAANPAASPTTSP